MGPAPGRPKQGSLPLGRTARSAKGASIVTGLILAGGRGERMGGADKGWVEYHGRPLIEHVVERLTPQVQS
ncbi:MAG: NTP transferase domain-containing protein, partial [Burkholderiaceae bacterium]